MSQPHNATTPKFGTPTSADACMSIVHSLMCYRQGAGERGESEQFSRRAIESLVRKLKEKREELDGLITAITTNGSQPTKCVTIPRTLDGRLQVAGRKCFPHVIYARIWRWPDLHKNELRRASGCHYSFDLKVDSVCVNPYHYIRDVSLGVDISTLTLCQVKNEQSLDGTVLGGQDPETYHYNSNLNYAIPPSYPPQVPQPLGVPPPSNLILEEPRPKSTVPQDYPINYSMGGPHLADPQEWVSSPQEDSTDFVENTATVNRPLSGEHQPPTAYNPFPAPDWAGLSSTADSYDPISKLPLPQHWCSITYYELDVQVGEIFKVPICHKSVAVDGYMERNDKRRFCLGSQSNVHRTDVSKRARLHIGRGVHLQLIGEGDVYLSCVSEHSIFIQSHYLDWMAGKEPGKVVHKMHKGAEFKVFDLRQFYHELKNQAKANGVGVHSGHFAPAITHASAANGIGIDELRRLCILRLSFVKGWGADYNRKTIKETPCWIEIQLHRALQVLDEVLLHTIPSSDHSTAKRQQQLMLAC